MNQIQHLAQAPRTYNIDADSAGDWSIDIDNNLSPGAHVVSVEDEFGNVDQAVMYVVKDRAETTEVKTEPIIIEKISTVMPEYLTWPLLLLTGAVAFLSIFLLSFARRASIREKKLVNLGAPADLTQKPAIAKHYLRYALLICIIAWVAVAFSGIFLARKSNFLSGFFDKKPKITAIDELKGQVLHPFEKTGVSDLYLSHNNTSIRTSGSGHYVFNNIGVNEGIKATHNELLRGFVFLPPAKQKSEEMNILFDVQLYNDLAKVFDAEARGRYSDIYLNHISPSIKTKINENDFVQNYQSYVKPANLTDQELVVKNVLVIDGLNMNKYGIQIDKAVAITLVVDNHELIYSWEYMNNQWYLLK